MASVGRPRVSVRIRQPGGVGLGGRYTLMVFEHPGSGLDTPIGSDQKRGDTVSLSVGYSRVFLLRFLPYL